MVIYGVPAMSERLDPEVPVCKALATFQFPIFSSTVNSAQISSESTPEPCYPRRAESAAQKPFYPDPRKRIFKLSLVIHLATKSFYSGAAKTETYTIFVHSDAFWNLLEDDILRTGQLPRDGAPKVIRWDLWSKYARWTPWGTPRDFRKHSSVVACMGADDSHQRARHLASAPL